MTEMYKLFLIRSDGSYSLSYCDENTPCEEFQICEEGDCICQKNYQYINNKCEKSLLPSVRESTIDDGEFPNTEVFITASQIALSAALLMGIAALIMVIYRLCTKPRYLSARAVAANSRTELGLDSSYNNYLRASLSSIQIRVLTRLRDRPPSYECRERNSITIIDSPPPYEDPGNMDTYLPQTLPPPYTEIVLSPTGYLNISFVDTESNSNTEHNSNTTNNKIQDTTSSETANVSDTGQQQQYSNNNDGTSSDNNPSDYNNNNNNNNDK